LSWGSLIFVAAHLACWGAVVRASACRESTVLFAASAVLLSGTLLTVLALRSWWKVNGTFRTLLWDHWSKEGR
jgi:hypothetical protein